MPVTSDALMPIEEIEAIKRTTGSDLDWMKLPQAIAPELLLPVAPPIDFEVIAPLNLTDIQLSTPPLIKCYRLTIAIRLCLRLPIGAPRQG